MSAAATVDLDDAEGLLEADRDGLLRAAAMAGAQTRAVSAAVDEGALESVAGGGRPRTVIWVAGRGSADTAGTLLAAALSAVAAEPIVVASESPPWMGPLDVLVVAGDDPCDPTIVNAAATAVRRGARVVVAAPYEGPLRDATAGRTAVLEPRLPVPDEFGLSRYLAAGLAALGVVDPGLETDLEALAELLDAEALRNSAARESFTNPAKALAGRMAGRQVVLAGDNPSTLALARHATVALLRLAGVTAAAVGLTDAIVALRRGVPSNFDDPVQALFHDEEIDGPLPSRSRVFALTLESERAVVAARVGGIDDVDTVGVEGLEGLRAAPALGEQGPVAAQTRRAPAAHPEGQLAVLAVRLEMASVYLKLVGG